MTHDTPLIATLVSALVLAYVAGMLAQRVRLSPLVGYLIAGIAIGPFTPGIVADQALAPELSELGVILLMFGVGLHFSLGDLLAVKAIAIPGAVVQIAIATLLGLLMSWLLGWSFGAGLVFGLALSVASTVVLLRAMQERRLIETGYPMLRSGFGVTLATNANRLLFADQRNKCLEVKLGLAGMRSGAFGKRGRHSAHRPVAS